LIGKRDGFPVDARTPIGARLIDTTLAVSLTADDSETQIARHADIIISEARRWARN